eukprot:GEMP01013931.1.p1 GENE.GEMP01013931.1~~GEMP01013931.1.p1  ORF type:complete len:888 (+),score=245.79 GEMP01013931.1:194-2857(+)
MQDHASPDSPHFGRIVNNAHASPSGPSESRSKRKRRTQGYNTDSGHNHIPGASGHGSRKSRSGRTVRSKRSTSRSHRKSHRPAPELAPGSPFSFTPPARDDVPSYYFDSPRQTARRVAREGQSHSPDVNRPTPPRREPSRRRKSGVKQKSGVRQSGTEAPRIQGESSLPRRELVTAPKKNVLAVVKRLAEVEQEWRTYIMNCAKNLDALGAASGLLDMEEATKLDGDRVLTDLLTRYIDMGAPELDVAQILGAIMYNRRLSLDIVLKKAEQMKLPKVVDMLKKAGAKPLGKTVIARVHGDNLTCPCCKTINDVKVKVAVHYGRFAPDVTIRDAQSDVITDDFKEPPDTVVAHIKDCEYDVPLLKEALWAHAKGGDVRGAYIALEKMENLGENADKIANQMLVDYVTGLHPDEQVCVALGAILMKRGLSLSMALAKACQFGHNTVVKILFKAKADLNQKEVWGHAPIYWATMENRKEVIRTLIRGNADVTPRTPTGWTPLHCAALNGKINIVGMLLRAKAAVGAMDNIGRSAMQVAKTAQEFEIMRRLEAAGAHYHPWTIDDYGDFTRGGGVLPSEYTMGDLEPNTSMNGLQTKNVNLDLAWGKEWDTEVEGYIKNARLAVQIRRQMLASQPPHVFEHGQGPRRPSQEGWARVDAPTGTSFFAPGTTVAERKKQQQQPIYRVDGIGAQFWALHVAAAAGEVGAMWELLEQKAYVNQEDRDGITALHKAVESANVEAVQLLLTCRADPNHDGGKQNMITPLLSSTRLAETDVLEMLIKSKADVNFVGKRRQTALGNAVRFADYAMVQLLIDGGILLDGASYNAAVHEAFQRGTGDIGQLLLEARDERDLDGTKLAQDTGTIKYTKEDESALAAGLKGIKWVDPYQLRKL